MSLYRLTTYAGGRLYAKRFPREVTGAVRFVPQRGTTPDFLFAKEEAKAIKRRLSRKPIRMKIKLEPA